MLTFIMCLSDFSSFA